MLNKFTLLSAAIALMFIGFGATAFAAPFKADGNPNIVANYDSGSHGIPGRFYLHEGADVVMRAGNSGNFQQWFHGISYLDPENPVHERIHSLWKVSKDGTCADGWILVSNASAEWGDYLVAGADYCVKNN